MEDLKTKDEYRYERLKYPDMKELTAIQILETLVDIRDVLMNLQKEVHSLQPPRTIGPR